MSFGKRTRVGRTIGDLIVGENLFSALDGVSAWLRRSCDGEGYPYSIPLSEFLKNGHVLNSSRISFVLKPQLSRLMIIISHERADSLVMSVLAGVYEVKRQTKVRKSGEVSKAQQKLPPSTAQRQPLSLLRRRRR